jgi:hemerythrin superfamily protein
MKATALLKKDHAAVKALFRRFAQTTPRAVKTRERLVAQLRDELDLHARLEEEIFYPAVRRLEGGERLITKAELEHETVKRLMTEIDGIAMSDPALPARGKALKDAVVHHATEEEKEIFAAAAQLGDDELERLGDEMADRKAALRAAGPPSRNALLGWPILAIVGLAAGVILGMRPRARRAA